MAKKAKKIKPPKKKKGRIIGAAHPRITMHVKYNSKGERRKP